MIRDLRFALRMLAARPGFTMFAALSLALGIGANSAIFSVVDAIWFRPAGVEHPGRLVRIFSDSPEQRQGMMSYPEFRDLRAQVSALSDVVAVGGRGLTLVEGDNRHLQNLNLVSANFFTALGIHAAAGRLFTPEDDHDSNVTVVLGNAFWRRHYGGDPAVVGRQIRIQRVHEVLATVIGVLPPDFQSLDTGSDRDMWFAEPAWKQLGEPEELEARGGRWFQVAGLLAPHATLREANAQVGAVAQRAAAAYPQTNTGRLAVAVSDLRYRMDAAGTNGLALLGIVLLVIVISSVNVANLLLSRAAARQTEMAIRLSIGADRLRLVRQLMVENVVLGACGVVFGLALGSVIIRVLPSLIVAPPGFISAVQFKLDDRVLVFTLIVGAATVLFFGIAPAWRSSRTDLVPALKGELTLMSTGRHWPLRNWLAVVQVAVSLTLLACAGVVVQSFSNTRTSNLGFQRREILNVWVAADAKPELYRSVVERFQQLPGVRSVAVAVRAPLSLSSNGMAQMVRMPGQLASTAPYEIKYNSVSANFFSTMGTQILRGRAFDGSDENGTANSVLINEKMADRFWPNEQPIGKTFTVGTKRPRLLQVIGVLKNAPINDIGEVPEPYLYLPYWSNFEQEATFMIETDGDAAALLETARKALKSVDARLDPLTIVTMNDLIRFSAQRYQLTAALVSALGIIGLLLTIVGIYGVVSYGVSLRTREFGIRMALGADREATLRQVVREVGILGLVGFALGIPAALFATHAMRALLFGVSPWSATAFAAALATLTASLMIAGMLPAGRATRIEPATALRTI